MSWYESGQRFWYGNKNKQINKHFALAAACNILFFCRLYIQNNCSLITLLLFLSKSNVKVNLDPLRSLKIKTAIQILNKLFTENEKQDNAVIINEAATVSLHCFMWLFEADCLRPLFKCSHYNQQSFTKSVLHNNLVKKG